MSDDGEDDFVSVDFQMLVGQAQLNELVAIDKQREKEREQQRELAKQHDANAMTLMQIAGLKSQKELDRLAEVANEMEDQKQADEMKKKKAEEKARLVSQFPPPNLDHGYKR